MLRPSAFMAEAPEVVQLSSAIARSCRWAAHQCGAYNTPGLAPITYRPFVPADLQRIRDIDRSEHIGVLYIQHGTQLEERHGDFDSPNWLTEGDGEHSQASQQAHVEGLLAAGAVAIGAFDGDSLAGIGVLVQHLRPGVAQLAYLHVSNDYRASGIGQRLSENLDHIAREGGDSEIVVSATPSQNTVRFYMARGYQPMAEPLPELFAVEPKDIHLQKKL
jgi:predicted N-acetyltransferase YhbS